MSIIEWAALGALMFVVLLCSARIMRRGLCTLDEDRKQYLAHMADGKKQLAEDWKSISAGEHMYMLRAALEDFLRLENCQESSAVDMRGHVIEIKTPDKVWRVELLMRERLLASTKKVLHGRGRWILSAPGVYEAHSELRELMASLNAHWHGCKPGAQEPDFVAKRVEATRRSLPRRKKPEHGNISIYFSENR